MMNEPYVVVKAKAAGASLLAKAAGAENWGEAFVMPMSSWRQVVEDNAYVVLSKTADKAWRELEFAGEAEYGVWLNNVNKAEVTRHTRAAKWIGASCHISQASYEEMRAKYFPWWQKTLEQMGWSTVKPRPMFWAKSGDPRPAEMAAYRQVLANHDFTSTPPGKDSELMRMAVRCDPSMKLYKLVLAKQKI